MSYPEKLQQRLNELDREYERRRKAITYQEDIEGHLIYIEVRTRKNLKELSGWYKYHRDKIFSEYRKFGIS